jgi:hypothetical protein
MRKEGQRSAIMGEVWSGIERFQLLMPDSAEKNLERPAAWVFWPLAFGPLPPARRSLLGSG